MWEQLSQARGHVTRDTASGTGAAITHMIAELTPSPG